MTPTQRARPARGAAGLLALIGPLAACTNPNATLGVSVVPPPQATVRFSADVRPILTDPQRGGCTVSGCHGGSPTSANMSLEQIFDPAVGAVNVSSCEAPSLKRIAPFDSNGSYLIRKLEGSQAGVSCTTCSGFTVAPSCGAMMPFGAPGLSAADIRIIREWIDQGAQDN